jgi:acyl-CoA reductase-like NAD-dependent aldehyde dehydrogenase
MRIAREEIFGPVAGVIDPALSFGGVGDSGLGRDLGDDALHSYCERKGVVIAL